VRGAHPRGERAEDPVPDLGAPDRREQVGEAERPAELGCGREARERLEVGVPQALDLG